MKKKISGTPQAPQKGRFWGQTKAEMGCFSQKGLCYSFGIFHGFLSNKNIRNQMKNIFGESSLHPQLTLLWPDNGKFVEIDSADRSACAARGCWHKRRWPLLVRAECVRCPWLLAQTKVAATLGILVRAECVRCPWLLAQTKVLTFFAPPPPQKNRFFEKSAYKCLIWRDNWWEKKIGSP